MRSILFIVFAMFAFELRANLVVNGGFENVTGNMPDNWTYIQFSGGATISSSAQVSPFTNRFPMSTRSVQLVDNTGLGPSLTATFAPQVTDLIMNFDFYIDDATLNRSPWYISPIQGNAFGYSAPFNIVLDIGASQVFVAGNPLSLTLEGNRWYNVQFSIDMANQQTAGTITQFGGNSESWANIAWTLPNLGYLEGINFSDLSASVNSPIFFDNVFVQAVPEPSSFALAGMTVLGLLTRRFRKRPGSGD